MVNNVMSGKYSGDSARTIGSMFRIRIVGLTIGERYSSRGVMNSMYRLIGRAGYQPIDMKKGYETEKAENRRGGLHCWNTYLLCLQFYQ